MQSIVTLLVSGLDLILDEELSQLQYCSDELWFFEQDILLLIMARIVV